jgi:tetratricopeptide (TPR) repeat protein
LSDQKAQSHSTRYSFLPADINSVGKTRKSPENINRENQSNFKSERGHKELDPKNAVYRSDRSECYIAMNEYNDALSDAIKSIQLDSSYWKGYSCDINCLFSLGDLKVAKEIVAKYEMNVNGVQSMK